MATQAAATHPLQLRPCVRRRPREPLASSEIHFVQLRRGSTGVQQVWLPGYSHDCRIFWIARWPNPPMGAYCGFFWSQEAPGPGAGFLAFIAFVAVASRATWPRIWPCSGFVLMSPASGRGLGKRPKMARHGPQCQSALCARSLPRKVHWNCWVHTPRGSGICSGRFGPFGGLLLPVLAAGAPPGPFLSTSTPPPPPHLKPPGRL